jgi:DNA-directed RNA polymerase subunit M/transcription elongation factor TFIIS
MIAFKSCPRCQGDLHISIENELSCLQCGYELRPDEKQRVLLRIARRRQAAAV